MKSLQEHINKPVQPVLSGKCAQAKPPPEHEFKNHEDVIQRAVGFEVEIPGFFTYMSEEEFYKHGDYGATSQTHKTPFKKGDTIFEDEGYSLQVDVPETGNAYLEFVTDPFEETQDGFLQMMGVMEKLYEFGKALNQKVWERNELDLIGIKGIKPSSGVMAPWFENATVFTRQKHVMGYFQMTAGIRQDKLWQLLEDLSAPLKEETQEMKIRRQAGRTMIMSVSDKPYDTAGSRSRTIRYILNAIEKVSLEEYPMSESLMGLLSSVVTYLYYSAYEIGKYAKSFTPLLWRTDFAKMFELLPEMEQEDLKAEDGKKWVEVVYSVCSKLHREDFSKPFFKEGIFVNSKPAIHRNILKDLSRIQWLKGIARGQDLLTERNFPNKLRAYELESLGSMGDRVDMVGHGQEHQAPIVEFRTILTPRHFSYWKSFAHSAFEMVYALNHDMEQKYGENTPLDP
ncbi:hypothetical protein [Aureibacter tunicatorum]|uniref:Uncharacterized protein n=1 Tax=Aureibacter tunicatorum TaxID=866807 RepID=A0AAE3XKI3_9BACT|nr:hypothetical protein [Aureibacter tunicatorum]MDR6237421.1 hypothetical protein [Aureibacter tunicatorum]BDD06411.1 hypothetical protein AUTU_38940 [Aureibacter tunicatorum]